MNAQEQGSPKIEYMLLFRRVPVVVNYVGYMNCE
jgi:hypothetical protein